MKTLKILFILLEAGKSDTHPFIHIPAGFINLMTNPAVNWLYSTGEQEELNNRIISMPEARF